MTGEHRSTGPRARTSRARTSRAGRVDQHGSASLLAVALAGVVLLLGLAAAFLTATAAGHRQAQAAADLAGLAGATARQRGEDPCAAAATIAAANGAELDDCRVAGADVVVSVSLEGPRHLGHGWRLHGEARAGPSGPSAEP